MIEFALAMCHIVQPIAFVLGTIRPDLNTESMPLALSHLPLVDSSIREYNLVLELQSFLL
jgi:hypothetical protein